MKLLITLGLFISITGLSVDRIYDPRDLLGELDSYLAPAEFEDAFNFKQSTTAMHRSCQYQYTGNDRQWRTSWCSPEETVTYTIGSIKSNIITVNYRTTQGNHSYSISKSRYDRVKGSQVRRILEDTVAYDAEIISLTEGKTIIDYEEITTRTVTIFYRISTARGFIGFYQEVTVSNMVPYISQIIDYASHDLNISTNKLITYDDED